MQKPAITGTAHTLPFDKLDPTAFERLCLWLVGEEGYLRVEHYGLGGSDQGRDVIAYKPTDGGEELWYFQCKRHKKIDAPTLKSEVDKVLELLKDDIKLKPDGIIFLISTSVSAYIRDEIKPYCNSNDIQCEFWAHTELDEKVKKSPRLLREFFQTGVKDERKTSEPEKFLLFIPHPYPEAPNFTGRKKERAMLTEWLTKDKEHPLLSMMAIGGMGKSALCWRWLQEEVIGKGVELDGIVWWSFYEREATYGAFINEFIKEKYPDDWKELQKASRREKIDLVLREFFHHKYLVIFDGFERTLRSYMGMSACYKEDDCAAREELRQRQCVDPDLSWFLRALTAVNCRSKTLLTTRLYPADIEGITGIKRLDLKQMDPDDAVEFFHKQGIKGTRAEIQTACEKYDYLPLCLRLLSGLIITQPKYRKDPDIKHAQNIPDMDLKKVDKNLRDAVKYEHILRYSYDQLKPEDQLLISNISAFRSPMESAIIKQINDSEGDEDGFRQRLECFRKRGLLFYDSEKDTYDLHPVVRRYCYSRVTQSVDTHESIRNFFVRILDYDEDDDWDEDEYEYEIWELTWKTIPILNNICEKYGLKKSGKKKEIIRRIMVYQEEEAEKKRKKKEEAKKGGLDVKYFQSLIGPAYESPKAVEDLQPIIELYHHTVRAGKLLEAWDLYDNRLHSPIYFQFGAYQTAIELMRSLFTVGENVPPPIEYESAQAAILNFLANSYSHSGQPCCALPLYAMSIALAEKLDNERSLAIRLHNLAIRNRNLADLCSAESNLRRGIEVAKETEDDWTIGQERQELGRTLMCLGRFGESETNLFRAREIWEKDNDKYGLFIIESYRTLRYLIEENPEESLNCARKADKYANWIGYAGQIPRNIIVAKFSKGAALVSLNRLLEAEEPLQFALTKCRKTNLVESEAPILLELAKLRHLQHNDSKSLSLATEALEIANRCSYVLQQADIEQFLGEFHMDQGNVEKARKYLEDSIEHCTHCWRYSEGEPDFDYVRKEDDFYYLKKENEWWYRPRWEKAMELIRELK